MSQLSEAAREAMRENGRRQGAINLETGHWDEVRKRGSFLSGKIVGRKNVESGHLARVRRKTFEGPNAALHAHNRGVARSLQPSNLEHIKAQQKRIDCAEAGRKSAHVRLHAELFNPQCKYCCGQEPESFLLA